MTELYHYPFLFAGWLGCFVTALNLLPVGQLDGGHVAYALFGRRGHAQVARLFLGFVILLGLPSFTAGIMEFLFPNASFSLPDALLRWSWPGWILWSFILARFIGTAHPPVDHELPLSPARRITGWLCILVFILTFTPVPFGIT